MKKAGFKKDGMTIIEVIVTLAVIGIVSTFLYTVLHGNWIGYNREILAADLQFEARTAVDKITKDIREAENVVLDTQEPHSLTLTLAGVNVVYAINANNQLTRQVGTQPVRVLCENVNQQNSGFRWSGPRAIDIDIQLVQPERIFNSDGTKEMKVNLSSSAQRRNL